MCAAIWKPYHGVLGDDVQVCNKARGTQSAYPNPSTRNFAQALTYAIAVSPTLYRC